MAAVAVACGGDARHRAARTEATPELTLPAFTVPPRRGSPAPVQPTVRAEPATASPGDAADRIWGYLRERYADAPWLGRILDIAVSGDRATVRTDIVPDESGRATASEVCRAVAGNDRVRLRIVDVTGTGDATAAVCS